jgi:quinolinate synthase
MPEFPFKFTVGLLELVHAGQVIVSGRGSFRKKIYRFKKERNAIILEHYYQELGIQMPDQVTP